MVACGTTLEDQLIVEASSKKREKNVPSSFFAPVARWFRRITHMGFSNYSKIQRNQVVPTSDPEARVNAEKFTTGCAYDVDTVQSASPNGK